jgi:neutral trehalase
VGVGRQLTALRPRARPDRRRRRARSRPSRPRPRSRRRAAHRPRLPALDEFPFVYVDLAFNAILAVAECDLAWLRRELGEDGGRADRAAADLRAALASRWDGEAAVFVDEEGQSSRTVADLFPLYAAVPDERQARRLWDEALWAPEHYGPSPDAPWAVTSASKSSPAFDARRYWRGPVWINLNWFLIRGLERVGLHAEAGELRELTLALVERSGFAEYYEPSTGEPLGSESFSWSAALTLDLLRDAS